MKTLLIFTFCLITDGTDAVTTVTGYRGRSVEIQCHYDPGNEEHTKYLCRGKCSVLQIKDIPVDSASAKDTRFSLYDNKTARIFTITITDLRPEDANTYWCSVQNKVSDTYTEILLLVKTDDTATINASQSTNTTHTTSTHCMNTSVFSKTTHSTTDDANHKTTAVLSQEFPGSTVLIAVSVVLLLLLTVLLFAVALQRKQKTKASSPAQPVQRSSNRRGVPCPDYEEINNSRCRSNSTTLPHSEVYANIEFPFDSSQAVYTTVQHPSHSPDQDMYFSPQSPKVLSDSSVSFAPPSTVKSGESPAYAAVCFTTSSNVKGPTVNEKNESNLCEYATVNVTKCDPSEG